ncbi:Uncharacterised protein [Mycobacteroides abscessus subsp. abscessus]|nr:Uncharacterised protein [Mycobacteroides abscessus subsp. abscessus]
MIPLSRYSVGAARSGSAARSSRIGISAAMAAEWTITSTSRSDRGMTRTMCGSPIGCAATGPASAATTRTAVVATSARSRECVTVGNLIRRTAAGHAPPAIL